MAIAIAVSMLFHAIFLFYHVERNPQKLKPFIRLGGPMSVELTPMRPAAKAQKPSQAKPSRPARRIPPRRRIIAVQKPAPVSQAAAPASQAAAPKMSFLDYVNRARAQRDAAQDEYPQAPAPVGPFPQQGKQPKGTSGLFQILRMDDDTAEIAFMGWHSEFSNAHREVFEVTAGADGDIRHAIVRKIIEIIRRYYQGDFNWESDRLGGSVVLSARPEDNAGLEAFLMKEFFGNG